MSLFGASSGFGQGGTSVFGNTTTDTHNPMKVREKKSFGLRDLIYYYMVHMVYLYVSLNLQDVEVTSPPDDSISCLAFSPPTLPGNFLIGGSWANDVRLFLLKKKKLPV